MNLGLSPIDFQNETVVITDPCYLINTPDGEMPIPDGVDTTGIHSTWEYCGYGFQLEKLGVDRYATADTLYGDWSCTVYEVFNKNKLVVKNKIGIFCADAGLVTVIPLSEVLRFNPRWLEWVKEHSHCATLISNFTGSVKIVHDDLGYGKECWVEGRGNINFISKQTGL